MSAQTQSGAASSPGLTRHDGNWQFATSIAILVVRLVLGWTFIYHGSQKLFGAFDGPGMEGVIKGFEGLHMPLLPTAAWAYMAALGEFIGGLSLFLGLLARLGSIPIIVTMLVAIAKVHGPNGFGGHFDQATKQMATGYELNLALIAMAAAVLLAGPGLISVDALIFRRGLWSRGPQPLAP